MFLRKNRALLLWARPLNHLDAAESTCDLVFSCPAWMSVLPLGVCARAGSKHKKRDDFSAPLCCYCCVRSVLSVHSTVEPASTTTVESSATTVESAGFMESTCGAAMHCSRLRQSS